MGRETDALVSKRFKLKMFGWPLLLCGFAGLALTALVVIKSLHSPFMSRRGSFGADDSGFSTDLFRDQSVIPKLAIFALVFGVLAFVGMLLLRKARNITLEMKATDAEVSRRLRVEERM